MQAIIDLIVQGTSPLSFARFADPNRAQHYVRMLAQGAGAITILVAVWLTGWANEPQFIDQPQDPGAEPFIERVISLTPDNAIIIAPWIYATSLAYAAYVDQRMGHRILETAWPGDEVKFIPGWLKTRPVIIINGTAALPATLGSMKTLDVGSPQLLRVEKVVPAK
jgi:hypothetical protein